MSASINSAFVVANRAASLNDDDIHEKYEFVKQKILDDNSLTKKEKTKAISILNNSYDIAKVRYNSGTKRICESCNQECLATFYCEYCVQNYLKENFPYWTSGNISVDVLIMKSCQMKTLFPYGIIEWIPYEKLQNIKFLTKGGYSEIYTANWINGGYVGWHTKKQQLKKLGKRQKVILKTLGNVGSENKRWFDEAKIHLTISNKSLAIVQCYGLTQNTSDGNYMLVIRKMDMDLRKYLQQNHNQLTWEERIQITYDIIYSLDDIHREKAIHRDLHSKNILYSYYYQMFYISDLGFCGPAKKPPKTPEVINGKEYTFKSDIYSVAMLMWEISSGRPPFINYEHDYDLAMNIINGIRPKIVPGTPLEYKNLIEQCWDVDPLKRPDVYTLKNEIKKINISYQNNPSKLVANNNLKINKSNSLKSKDTNSALYTSQLHQFENLSEPRNATEGIVKYIN
ncbi:Skm1p [Rhizophagus irregularis DAOM 197198w]|uniref:Skm1p n=1 Tax=Rhizophagus irregularis (strain DAOM 197198w) TaxID=1432141 RepID=A0A015K9J9_RHIIW|nr:Skm1p [Rhizophagus irregularis DAOM 197198w]